MDKVALQALQTPLKERYRAEPEAARITWSPASTSTRPIDLDTDASPEQVDARLRLTERYCVVYQTLSGSPEVAMRLHGQSKA